MSGYTTTPTLGLLKPTVGGDDDAWGGHINQNADTLDSTVASKAYTDARRRRFLNAVTTSIPNVGAGTTEEVAAVWTLPAGLLANVGDIIHIVVKADCAGTTDVKQLRVRLTPTSTGLAGSVAGGCTGNVTTTINIFLEVWIMKSGANAQKGWSLAVQATNNIANTDIAMTNTDTGALYLGLTMQNSTAAAPGSLTIFSAFAEFLPAV